MPRLLLKACHPFPGVFFLWFLNLMANVPFWRDCAFIILSMKSYTCYWVCNAPGALKIRWLFQQVSAMLPKPMEAVTQQATRPCSPNHFQLPGTSPLYLFCLCVSTCGHMTLKCWRCKKDTVWVAEALGSWKTPAQKGHRTGLWFWWKQGIHLCCRKFRTLIFSRVTYSLTWPSLQRWHTVLAEGTSWSINDNPLSHSKHHRCFNNKFP